MGVGVKIARGRASSRAGPAGQCDLAAFAWRAQYFFSADVLVTDDLVFDRASGTFEQNITAFPFQVCPSNSVFWEGDYTQLSATETEFQFKRCTVSAVGCVTCGLTRTDVAETIFDADCSTFTAQFSDGSEAMTYFAEGRRRTA